MTHLARALDVAQRIEHRVSFGAQRVNTLERALLPLQARREVSLQSPDERRQVGTRVSDAAAAGNRVHVFKAESVVVVPAQAGGGA